jgi:hypothetical protein
MPDQTKYHSLPISALSPLILGLGLAWAALTLLAAAGVPLTAHAQEGLRYVASGGIDAANDCTDPAMPCASLQHAVDVAESGDEIRVATGRYMDVHIRPAPSGYFGPSSITQVVYISKSLTLRGGYAAGFTGPPDPATHPTVVDALQQGRAVFIAGPATVTLAGLDITGGDAADQGAGGGLYLLNATTLLNNNRVVSSTASSGGGMYVLRGAATLVGNCFLSNTATSGGGACPDRMLQHTHGQYNCL